MSKLQVNSRAMQVSPPPKFLVNTTSYVHALGLEV